MHRTLRVNSAPGFVAGLGLALCLGCGHPSSTVDVDASGTRTIGTTDTQRPFSKSGGAQARNAVAAPSLLTESEIAAAAPLQPVAAACEYRTPAPAQSADSILRNPGPAQPTADLPGANTPSYSYSPEYDEAHVWKGNQSGPPATVSPCPTETFGAHPWLNGITAPPCELPAPRMSASPLGIRPLPSPVAVSPARTITNRVVSKVPEAIAAAETFSEGPSSPLPSTALKTSGPELDTARRQADESVHRAFALAERGALFSAQSEFIQTMRDLAQALDAAEDTSIHTQALALGLRAVQEADDFQPKGARIETQLPLAVLIASHQTPVLKNSAGGLTPQQAKQLYYSFAQEQLAVSLGNEPIGSLALFALAKTQAAIDAKKPGESAAALARAMTYHKAALLVEPNNFLAANDLGVLLARQGRWEEARTSLEHSLAISPQTATWQNLAVVQQNMNQPDLARQSQQQAESLAQRQPGAARGSLAVQWLDAANFAQTSINGAIDTSSPAAPPARVAQAQNATGDAKRAGAATSTNRN